MIRRLPTFALLIVNLACGPEPFKPEVLHPSPERMQELLNAPLPAASQRPLDFEVRVRPAFVLAGQDAWVTCYVPERYGTGWIRYGIDGIAMHEGVLDHVENRRLIEGIACGTWVVTCDIVTARGKEHREFSLVSKGVCNDGTSPAGGSHP